jgi:hypothetical protein
MPLEPGHFKGFYFLDFFPQCVQLLRWNFVHGFIVMTYRSSSKVVAINQYFGKVMPLELNHFKGFYSYMLLDFTVFGTFFRNVYMQSLHLNFVHEFILIR